MENHEVSKEFRIRLKSRGLKNKIEMQNIWLQTHKLGLQHKTGFHFVFKMSQ